MTGELIHPAWLPDRALAALGRRRVAVVGDGPLVATVREEVTRAVDEHGWALVDRPDDADLLLAVVPGADLGSEGYDVGRDNDHLRAPRCEARKYR